MDRELVLTPLALDVERRDPPCVHECRVQRRPILFAWQHLTESAEAHRPGTEVTQPRLQRRPDAGCVQSGLPSPSAGAALESVAANEVGMPCRDVAEARHVDAVGSFADGAAVGPAVEHAAGTAPLDVIHDVPADLIARITDSRVEQNPRAFERRCAEKDNTSRIHAFRACLGIDTGNTGDTITSNMQTLH